MKRNIYEGFGQALLGNGNIYGNIISLNDPSNIPIYLNKFHIYSKTGLIERAPSLWKLYASNDNDIWIEITDASSDS